MSLPITLIVGAVALVMAWRRFAWGYPQRGASFERLASREVALLSSASEAMYPQSAAIPVDARDADVPGYVDRWFRVLHPARSFQIRLLLIFFEHATLFFPGPDGWRGFGRFSSQPLASRVEILRAWNQSDFFLRRLVFTALRAVLTMGYLGHPSVMRQLHLAPFDFESPVSEADTLYPPVGEGPDAIPFSADEITEPSAGVPIPLDSPIHPSYREKHL